MSLKDTYIECLNRDFEALLEVKLCATPCKFFLPLYTACIKEKGLGLFDTADIPIQNIICEYKTTKVYSNTSHYHHLVQEYEANQEPCKLDFRKSVISSMLPDEQTNMAYANHSNDKLLPRVCQLRSHFKRIVWDYRDRKLRSHFKRG